MKTEHFVTLVPVVTQREGIDLNSAAKVVFESRADNMSGPFMNRRNFSSDFYRPPTPEQSAAYFAIQSCMIEF
ncbi:MAG TPA: hypothetical protein VLF90_03580 [Patescibacteria group bacterium]|nr:hypothetical protein [Patescibacteria group bacterium]